MRSVTRAILVQVQAGGKRCAQSGIAKELHYQCRNWKAKRPALWHQCVKVCRLHKSFWTWWHLIQRSAQAQRITYVWPENLVLDLVVMSVQGGGPRSEHVMRTCYQCNCSLMCEFASWCVLACEAADTRVSNQVRCNHGKPIQWILLACCSSLT